MKRLFLAAMLISVIIVTAACVPPPGPGVRVDHLPPPLLLFPAPPLLAFWPGYDIYVCVNLSSDLVFYRGTWYRYHGGDWYRSGGHKGPWKWMPPGQIPKSLRGLPVNMRDRVQGQPRVKHQDVKRNWRKWERDRNTQKKREQDEKRIEREEKKLEKEKKNIERKEKRYRDEKQKKEWQEKKKKSKKNDSKDDDDDDSGKGRGNKGKKGKNRK